MNRVVSMSDLPALGPPGRFVLEGYLHGLDHLTVIVGDSPPGSGIPLHSHEYEEVFIVHGGRGSYTVGDTTIEAGAGDIVVIPSGVPHRFVNTSQEPLAHTAIHARGKMESVMLE